MKIDYIVEARMPTEKAHGLQIAKMCEVFVQLGHDVQLVLPRRKNAISESVALYYSLKKSFPVRYISTIDLVSNFGFLGSFVYRLHVFFFTVRLFMFAPREGAVVYTRTPEIAWLFKKRGYRVICEVHDWPESYEYIFRSLLKKVDVLPCNSEGTEEVCRAHGLMQTMVAHNGVTLEDFDISVERNDVRDKLGIMKEKFVVMYIGSLEKWKGAETLFQASEALSDEYKIVIIGGKTEEVETFKKEYPKVQFLGYRPYVELPENQKAADLLVVPNVPVSIESEKYTSPIKLFAHMASGVPVLVSDLSSLRAIVDDSAAYFFEAGNSNDLVQKIEQIRSNNVLAKGKAERSLKRVETYTWRSRAENIIVQLNRTRV